MNGQADAACGLGDGGALLQRVIDALQQCSEAHEPQRDLDVITAREVQVIRAAGRCAAGAQMPEQELCLSSDKPERCSTSMESFFAQMRKQEDSCGRGVPALNSVGLACVNLQRGDGATVSTTPAKDLGFRVWRSQSLRD